MRVEPCYLCHGFIVAWPSRADLSWDDIGRAIRRHNGTHKHQHARTVRGL